MPHCTNSHNVVLTAIGPESPRFLMLSALDKKKAKKRQKANSKA